MEPHAPTLSKAPPETGACISYSRQSLVDRASALIPLLSARAAETSEARRIPEKTISDFWEAGLFNLLKPKKFNGPEVRADVVFEIAAILARGDGSAAWVWNLLGMHDLFVALLPLEAQQEYWAKDRTLGASSFAANGRAKLAKGGFTLSGKWSFCSGVDCADWMLLGAKCDASAISPTASAALPRTTSLGAAPASAASPTEPRTPEIRWVLIPKSDCRVVDDWHVLGLRGTGSKSVMVDEAFVPEHRTVRYDQLVAGQAPGGKLHASPLYRAPLWAVFTLGICAPAIGIARGASESFIQEMKTRVWGMDYAPQAKNPAIQLRLAEATAMIDAADLLYQRSLTQTIDKIMAGETPTLEDRIRSRRDQAYAVRTSTRAVEMLLDAQGGKGLYEAGQVQRAFRDLHAMSAHIMAGWDMPALSYGQVALGGPPTSPFY